MRDFFYRKSKSPLTKCHKAFREFHLSLKREECITPYGPRLRIKGYQFACKVRYKFKGHPIKCTGTFAVNYIKLTIVSPKEDITVYSRELPIYQDLRGRQYAEVDTRKITEQGDLELFRTITDLNDQLNDILSNTLIYI